MFSDQAKVGRILLFNPTPHVNGLGVCANTSKPLATQEICTDTLRILRQGSVQITTGTSDTFCNAQLGGQLTVEVCDG